MKTLCLLLCLLSFSAVAQKAWTVTEVTTNWVYRGYQVLDETNRSNIKIGEIVTNIVAKSEFEDIKAQMILKTYPGPILTNRADWRYEPITLSPGQSWINVSPAPPPPLPQRSPP
jgi:hypothetical protein